jgi:hypothetical protein
MWVMRAIGEGELPTLVWKTNDANLGLTHTLKLTHASLHTHKHTTTRAWTIYKCTSQLCQRGHVFLVVCRMFFNCWPNCFVQPCFLWAWIQFRIVSWTTYTKSKAQDAWEISNDDHFPNWLNVFRHISWTNNTSPALNMLGKYQIHIIFK